MNHTHRLPIAERLQRIEDQLRMLAWFAGGRHESVPTPAVWSGLQDLLNELAGELREVHDGLSVQVLDESPAAATARSSSEAPVTSEPLWQPEPVPRVLRPRLGRAARSLDGSPDDPGPDPAE